MTNHKRLLHRLERDAERQKNERLEQLADALTVAILVRDPMTARRVFLTGQLEAAR